MDRRAQNLCFTLCADDYALSPAVSRGILEALAAQRLSAVGCMTGQPGWLAQADALKPHAGQADIGLHLCLTLGRPLSAMPILCPEGIFPTLRQIMMEPGSGASVQQEIRAEIARQIDAFMAGMGCIPDFIDGHQHVHILPPIRDALLAELKARGWAGRVWLRNSADQFSRITRRGRMIAKALTLAWLGRGFKAAAHAAGFATNDGFAGFSNFSHNQDYGLFFSSFLLAPGPRHLVMCHPGYVDDLLVQLDPVTQTRPKELAFLLSAEFEAQLEQAKASICRMKR